MSEITKVTKENLWDYYEKLSDWEAKCKFCGNKLVYHNEWNFHKHLKRMHKEIFEYEETYKGRQEWPWIFFKYNDTSTSRCLFCTENVQSDFEHLALHLRQQHSNSEEVKNYVSHGWMWKYGTKSHDLKVECSVCPSDRNSEYNVTINTYLTRHLITHSDKLGNVQEEANVVASSKCIRDSKVIEIKENMWEYFTKLPNFRAKCKILDCHFENLYVFIRSLISHIRNHKAIFKWEEAHKEWPWKYFKYSFEYTSDKDTLYSECLVCGTLVRTSSESEVQSHLLNHSKSQLDDIIIDCWAFKYFTEGANNEIKCNICCRNISAYFNNHLNHTIENHSEQLQWNISTRNMQKLRRNYNISPYFQATCKFNDFSSYYIDRRNVIDHMIETHVEVFQYEEPNKGNYPWMFFKYKSSTHLQCNFCDLFYPYDYDELNYHLSFMHTTVISNYEFLRNWELKYCGPNGDFGLQCNIDECRKIIYLDVPLLTFDRHIQDVHPNSLTSTQRTYGIAGPSGCQAN